MNRMLKRKAQTTANAGQAATVVIFIALLIILYLFMIPPKDRDEILGINSSVNEAGNTNYSGLSSVLLDESPGSLYPIQHNEFVHPINQIVLSSSKDNKILAQRDSLYVATSKLNKKTETIDFSAGDGIVKSLFITFNVDKGKGRLIIKFNGHEIMNREVKEGTVNPIKLPTEYLKENNRIEISASDVGLAIFSRHYYELSDVNIVASTENLESQRAFTTIIISKEEIKNFKSGYIRFIADCPKTPGTLKVYLNGAQLVSKTPSCGSPDKIDFTKNNLYEGENNIKFEITRGNVYLTNIAMIINLNKPKWPVYYFMINDSIYKEIQNNEKTPILQIKFVDDYSDKQGTININGAKFFLDEDSALYERNIKNYIVKGNNYIKIIPSSDLDIVSLRVYTK